MGNRLNFGAEFLLNAVEIEAILPIDQVDSQTEMSETARTTDTMQIRLCVLGEIEVDNDVHSLNVDTSGQQIRADKVAAHAVAEVVEYAITIMLQHTCMRIETRVSKFSDLLCKKLDTVRGIAENDGLVDLQLVEESVQAVHLLLLLNKGIVLCDTAESQFVHEIDLVRGVHMLVLHYVRLCCVAQME